MTLTFAPFSLPAELLVTFAAVIFGLAVGNWVAARRGVAVGRTLWIVIVGAVLLARAVFAARYWANYEAEPWRLMDIRDGGFAPFAGLAAATLIGGWLAWRKASERRAIAAATATGVLVWLLGSGLVSALAPALRIPSITLRDLDGRAVPMAGFGGRPMVVNLWATWCPPCRREMPALRRAQQENPDLTFVFANQGESPATIRAYLLAEKLSLRNVVLDPGGQLARATASPGLPTTLFFNAAGILVDKRMGELSSATLAQRLARLRGGAVPAQRNDG